MTLIRHTYSTEETQNIAVQLANELYQGANICLFGEMGAGKTHFIKAFLKACNVHHEVTSPTFTFVHQYNTDNDVIVHADLYRLQGEDIGLEEYILDENTTTLIEWSERLESLPPSRVEVYMEKTGENERTIQIKYVGYTFPEEQLQKIIQHYRVPPHVQKHINAVCKVSAAISDHLLEQGALIDKELIRQAALLHDVVRYVDFKGGLDPKKFPYKVDKETWNFWVSLREKYNNRHHADVINEILVQKGYPWIGKLILAHKSSAIFHGLQNTAEKILHYADKRCKHETIVPLQERINDLENRYHNGEKNHPYWVELRKKNELLEQELNAAHLSF